MSHKKYKKFTVIGSHGAGKSTFASQLGYHLRAKGYNVDTVQERVRYSPFPFNEHSTIETQLWVYHVQICRELESVVRGFNRIICDRSAIDCLIYAKHRGLNNPYFEKVKAAADEWMLTYDKIFFLRPDINLADDGIRAQDDKFRTDIDVLFKEYMDEWQNKYQPKVPVYEIKTTEIINHGIKSDWLN